MIDNDLLGVARDGDTVRLSIHVSPTTQAEGARSDAIVLSRRNAFRAAVRIAWAAIRHH